ncbi:polypeptide N-acetylgalactosaminyltransferase 13-like [Contarinia nasturtii]|uniref:polypeptide N-acetylgalactosaminyltransferase 13-like n=1 Tax=Contarinia nasturtii TaxID=265458 RepID=UPI0012D3F48F|nr:polypeptide N-acetylgalactosaminyltransferase 13-like [Contarinia nasturtii]
MLIFCVKIARSCFKKTVQLPKSVWLSLIVIFLIYLCFMNVYLIRNTHEKNELVDSIDELSSSTSKDSRSNWPFQISQHYDHQYLHKWTEPTKIIISNPSGRGENGSAFVPTKDEEELMKELKQKHNYNVLASDKISTRRSLQDHRFPECRSLVYPEKLPKASVIIVIHNEIWSTLFRTIWSIIDRSPRELIEEIILVDDASTWPHLKQSLDDYIVTLPVRMKVLRIKKREGLIRARLMGAKEALGNVLIFLDAHIECTEGWLQPILSRIASDRSVVTVPLIDSISSNDMSHYASGLFIHGLRWYLIFTWMEVPQREIIRTKNNQTSPLRTPTHVGCAFAIDREFFFEIGSYDEGMDIWGSENVELAWRTWMCGGSMEILPCSRIGHLFRISTYSFDGNEYDIKTRNNNRLIEVWMDEFKDYIYAAYPSSKKVSPGDLTERKNLRKRLKCKSFRWYLQNVYPESVWLKEYTMMGNIKSVVENKCLDSNAGQLIYQCHGLGGTQFFALTKSGQFVTVEEMCVGVSKENRSVILIQCAEEDKSQLWNYNKEMQWIRHNESELCMKNNQTSVILEKCSTTDIRLKWEYKTNL